MKNILTVDLEDWFSGEVFQTAINRQKWDNLESVVVRNTEKLLDIFKNYDAKATFFVLGWIADKYPDLIREVAVAGHEIACHSFYHRMASSLTLEEFKKDTELAIDAIIKSCGQTPLGYRSPSWGMREDMLDKFEALTDFGFRYDSSIYPIYHDIYGDPNAPQKPHEIELPSGRTMIEIPASTIKILGHTYPVGGGGWLRQLPYWFTRRGIKKLNRVGLPVMIYLHPWELDPNIPRFKVDLKNRIRTYAGLHTMTSKVENLLDDFDFMTVTDYIESVTLSGGR
jgi:polysaccharide deacetylase family protein (PEP-CTERM system associated)